MMAKKPAERYQTPSDVAQALKPFVSGAKERKPAAAHSVAKPASAPVAGLPSWMPPLPPPLEPMKSFSPAEPTDSSESMSRRHRLPAQGNKNGMWPAWMVYAAGIAASLVTTGLFGWLLLTLTASLDKKPDAEASKQATKQDAAAKSGQRLVRLDNPPITPVMDVEKLPIPGPVPAVAPIPVEEKPPVPDAKPLDKTPDGPGEVEKPSIPAP